MPKKVFTIVKLVVAISKAVWKIVKQIKEILNKKKNGSRK